MKLHKRVDHRRANWYEWFYSKPFERFRISVIIPSGETSEEASIHFVCKVDGWTFADDYATLEDTDLFKLRNDIDTYLISKGF